MSTDGERRVIIGGRDVTDHIKANVAKAPPLSPEQHSKLYLLFHGSEQGSEQHVPPAPIPVRQHVLYRWYDEDDVLLYIGITSDLKTRSRNHLGGSAWTEFAVRQDVSERHDTREDLEAAERQAIGRERPIFNVVHAPSDANTRMVEYLIQRGRTDLLVAKVDRG